MNSHRERAVVLDAATQPLVCDIGTLLVGIYRSPHTDLLYVRLRLDNFAFELDLPRAPANRKEAVTITKQFLQLLAFDGPVRWQLGGAGAITEEPHLGGDDGAS